VNTNQNERVVELEGLIQQARHDYYNSTPTVSDTVFDAWIDELSQLKPTSSAVTAVGTPPDNTSEWKKVILANPMGSLDKVNTLGELTTWFMNSGGKSDPIFVSEKLDGISIGVSYVNGVFSQATTRGDGTVGEDISVNVARMQGVPGKLPKKFTGSLRGEILLYKSVYAKYFSEEYKNARNTAGGISKRYDGVGCEKLNVRFYQVMEGQEFETEGAQFEWLTSMGLQVPNWYVTAMIPGVRTPHDLWLEYQQFKRDELDYEIDALVVRFNSILKQLELGEVDNKPKGAVAFKFAPMTRESILQRIDWQVGGSGRITPVAVFNPVELSGATVTNATLYNWGYIKSLDLTLGCKIIVARAGDVIPKVLSKVTTQGAIGAAIESPMTCPVCGSSTQMEGEYLICSNTAGCPAQTVGRIKRYIAGMDIKEWGDVLIEKLVESKLVTDVSDLYCLTEDQLASIDRMGSKSAATVVKKLRERCKVSLETLLGSLSIPLCAEATIKMATSAGFDSLEKLKGASIEQLFTIEGLGPVKAQALWTWLQKESEIVAKLESLGVEIEEKIHGRLTGKSFCFTGASSKPRNELEELVRKAGGEVKKSVGKKLTYLVMADANSTSSKAQAARKNGTTCISEEQFLGML